MTSAETLFSFIRLALTDTQLKGTSSDADWQKVIDLSFNQGVDAISVDGYHKWLDEVGGDCALETDESLEDLKFEWFGSVLQAEEDYRRYITVLGSLAKLFADNGLKMVLLKGLGLSQNYPIPAHRPLGDIDLYHYGQGENADKLIKEKLGIEVKQNEEKHSVYEYDGIHVENHAIVINVRAHNSLTGIERFLEQELKDHSEYNESIGCYLPSAMFNAVYLPLHIGGHFVYGGANLRQVLDYALVVKKHYQKIDWDKVKELADTGGYYPFLCCLNGICIDKFGIEPSYFPGWEYDKNTEEKILNDILNPQTIDAASVWSKAHRFFSNRWKYQLVYGKDSHLKGFFLRLRSWLIWKWGIGRKSVWNS